MIESLAKRAAKELLKVLKDWAKNESKPLGEWRGKYAVVESGEKGKYIFVQDAEDPLRLFVYKTGLEYAISGNFKTDFATIPKIFHGIKEVRLKPRDWEEAASLHDFIYDHEGCYVRDPAGRNAWTFVIINRVTGDVIFCIGLTAKRDSAPRATNAEKQLIYRAVRGFARKAWNDHRKRDRDGAEHKTTRL